MPVLKLRLDMKNAAFNSGMATETARILREVAERIEQDGDSEGILRDINGNTCGEFQVK